MTIEHEAWGGLAITWCGGRLVLLVDLRDAWLAWDSRPVRRVAVGAA